MSVTRSNSKLQTPLKTKVICREFYDQDWYPYRLVRNKVRCIQTDWLLAIICKSKLLSNEVEMMINEFLYDIVTLVEVFGNFHERKNIASARQTLLQNIHSTSGPLFHTGFQCQNVACGPKPEDRCWYTIRNQDMLSKTLEAHTYVDGELIDAWLSLVICSLKGRVLPRTSFIFSVTFFTTINQDISKITQRLEKGDRVPFEEMNSLVEHCLRHKGVHTYLDGGFRKTGISFLDCDQWIVPLHVNDNHYVVFLVIPGICQVQWWCSLNYRIDNWINSIWQFLVLMIKFSPIVLRYIYIT